MLQFMKYLCLLSILLIRWHAHSNSINTCILLNANQSAIPDEGCITSTGTRCYETDPRIFNCICNVGDYCIDAQDERTGLKVGEHHARYDCPGSESFIQRGPWHMGCLYKPLTQPQIANASLDLQTYFSKASSTGHFDCHRNVWIADDIGHALYVEDVGGNYDAIITYGDSISANIWAGLGLIINNYTMTKFWINRNDAEILASHGSRLSGGNIHLHHFCCSYCACGHSVEKATSNVVEWVVENRIQRTLLIFRNSLHTEDDPAVVNEITTLVTKLQQHTQISTIYMLFHGSGSYKPQQYVNQLTSALRIRDDRTVALLKAQMPPQVPLVYYDPSHMFLSAECNHRGAELRTTRCKASCFGAFESPDGTHLSPTLQVAIAQVVLAGSHLLKFSNFSVK